MYSVSFASDRSNVAIPKSENNSQLQSLLLAIEISSEEGIGKILSELNSSDFLHQALLKAYTLHKTEIIKFILNQPICCEETLKDIFAKIIELYDSEGNHVALEWVKLIDNESLREKITSHVKKIISENQNIIFSKHYQYQLQRISNQVEIAIKRKKSSPNLQSTKSHHWTVNFQSVQKATVDEHVKQIKKLFQHQRVLTISYAGFKNDCMHAICQKLDESFRLFHETSFIKNSVDLVLAPYTLYEEMESLFKASEDLLNAHISLEEHPLFGYFESLKAGGLFIVTLHSGPNIEDFTNMMLSQHELQLEQAHLSSPKLNIFNNVETFFRCLDIFKKYFEDKTN